MISAPLQKAFMLLLRQGLWDRQEDCSALFPLDEKEWNEIHGIDDFSIPAQSLLDKLPGGIFFEKRLAGDPGFRLRVF